MRSSSAALRPVWRHLGWPTTWVRVGFVVSTLLGGVGVMLYAAFWLFVPAQPRFVTGPAGLESASRGGRRPGRVQRLTDIGPVLILSVLVVGFVFGANAVLGPGAIVWPLAIAGAGVALLWRQADETQRERWIDAGGRIDPVRVLLGRGGWAAYARIGAGVLLIAVAIGVFALRGGSISVARDVTVAALLGVIGLAVVIGPWMFRLAGELADERSKRVRTQERADMAAHLHDSVLQTLALIQKNADNSAAVARLARSQERDLRSWLFVGDDLDAGTVGAALRAVAAEIEDSYELHVDVVIVGDGAVDAVSAPIVAAAREALVNAAKHAGVGRADVYAEIDEVIEIFVRDRGVGFDVDAIPEDRQGLRNSVIGRLERHGGTADVRSTPGDGTEVRLSLPVADAPSQEESHG